MTNRRQHAVFARWGVALRLSSAALAAATLGNVAFPSVVQAQEYRFQTVKIEGNRHIEPATVLSLAKIPKGTAIDASGLNDAYQRLQSSGLFESVDLVPQGRTLVIKVQEYPVISTVAFEGNHVLNDDTLTKTVKTQANHVFSPSLVEADAAGIAQGYAEAGRPNVRVDPKVIKRSDDRVDVVFEIREGATSEVKRISFAGNRSYSDWRLRQVLDTKQAGIFHKLIRSDNFVADRIAEDRQKLEDFYRSRGYPDVRVTGVSSEMARDRAGFFLTFNIEEGQQYKFNKITTVSNVPELNAADFAPLQKIKTGSYYTPTAIDLAVTRMEQLALRKGANFVSVDPKITRDPATQTLNVEFDLVKAPRRFVERIDIEGNTTTKDSVIRREFDTVEGDPFNPRAIHNASERIKALGYFKTANVTTKPGSADDQVIVDVNVEEQPTGTLSFGASYGVSSGFGVAVSLREDNFLGRGQTVGVSIGTTSDNQKSSLDFIEPYFLGRPIKARMHVWYDTTQNDNADYSTRMQGISPSFEFPVAENSRLELRYSYAKNKLFGVDAYDADEDTGSSPILTYEQSLGERATSAVGYTYTWDVLNSGLDPRYGYSFAFSQDLGGVGGDVDMLKTTALLKAQRKIMHEQVSLRAELEGGAIQARNGTDLTILDRFSGYGKVRGFETNGYGPRDLGAPNDDALGGKYYAALRLESEFPLGLPEEYGITGGLFWDTGSLWGLDNKAGVQDPVDDGMHIRSAIGFSIFWRSVIGPLRLNFSKAIMKEDYDKEQNFDLTISTRF